MTTLGYRIRRIRRQLDVNQKDFASKVGVTQPSVSKWEKDIDRPDEVYIRKIVELSQDIKDVHEQYNTSAGLVYGGDTTNERSRANKLLLRMQDIEFLEKLEQPGHPLIGSTKLSDSFSLDPILNASFAVLVEDDGMSRYAPKNSIVFVDIRDNDLHDKFVGIFLVKQGESERAYFRTYYCDGPERLEPTNSEPDIKTIFLEKDSFRVFGRVIFALREVPRSPHSTNF